jgi:hypothetical protein
MYSIAGKKRERVEWCHVDVVQGCRGGMIEEFPEERLPSREPSRTCCPDACTICKEQSLRVGRALAEIRRLDMMWKETLAAECTGRPCLREENADDYHRDFWVVGYKD